MNDVIVRRAGVDDLDALTPLFTAYRRFYEQPEDAAADRHFLRARLESGESTVFLAHVDGAAAGFTQLYPCYSSVALKRVWVLNDLYTSEAARGRGVGTALLERARAFAAESGARGLVLETAPDNPAQKLYEKLGWRRDPHLHYNIEC